MNEYPCEDTCISVFFFKGIFVRSQKGYHPEEDVETIGYHFQEDLAKYCYKIKAGRGKKIISNHASIFWLHTENQACESGD
jgi:hypothetical protein